MFGSKRRRLAEDLAWEKHRNQLLRKQLREVTEERESWKWAATHAMGSNEDALIRCTRERNGAIRKAKQLQKRLDRAVRACARYRTDATQQTAVTDRLTEQLFDALGYDEAARTTLAYDPVAHLIGEAVAP